MSATITPQLATGTWNIDSVHSTAGFGVKHFGVSTYRGEFTDLSGSLETAEGRIAAVDGTIKIASLTAKDATLAGHLLGEDFFAADKYPEGTFKSTSIVETAPGEYTIKGELTLRGITKPVELAGEIDGAGQDPYGNERLGLDATGEIDRTEFGISWNAPLPSGGFAVAERVRLELHVEAIKAS